MSIKLFSAALLASTLLAGPALAQSSPPAEAPRQPAATAPATPSASAAQASAQSMKAGQWRGSKLMGLDVYNDANEKIGDVKEVIMDSSGKAETVVIGVGGFLGMGEHNVGLAWNQVKFMNEAPRTAARTDGGTARTTTTTTTTTGTGTGTATGTTARTSNTGQRDYPDHAVVNMTKDQLKAMPAFKYASDNR
jgi:sporulation protein YlmC with PRC-barrel domain